MKIIGLTGSIGTGKSSVSTILRNEFKLEIIDADEISRLAVSKGSEGLSKIIDTFGKEYLDENGELARKKMAALVFSNEEKRKQLNDIVHPQVKKEFYSIVEKCRKRGDKYVIFDCPLLIEEKLMDMVDCILLVYTRKDIQLKRIMLRDNMTKEEALARINSQMDQDEKKKYADIVIENNGSIFELENAVEKICINEFNHK